jgi:hypothetical protein
MTRPWQLKYTSNRDEYVIVSNTGIHAITRKNLNPSEKNCEIGSPAGADNSQSHYWKTKPMKLMYSIVTELDIW